jgi:hypothetical protein
LDVSKRILNVFIGLAVVTAVFMVAMPLHVSSEGALFAGGSGTPEDPYQISTCEHLQNINTDLSAHYVLVDDVDCSATQEWNEGAGFVPLIVFSGTIDGNGYKITDLFINRPASDIALFGRVEPSGEISDIALENVDISGNSNTGALVGTNKGSIADSYATGSVRGRRPSGGLVGFNHLGSVSNSYAAVSVSSYAMDLYIGGLVGQNYYGSISESYATGSVSGYGDIGGLVGGNHGGSVSDSYATGSVSGKAVCGGLVGENSGPISNSYSTGPVSCTGWLIGGLVGYSWGTVSGGYWDTETSGQSSSAGGEGKTTAEMKQQATFVDWDFMYIWNIQETITYPYLRWENTPPAAEAGGPYSADEGSSIAFDASASTDPNGDDLQYRWDFDSDGIWDTEYSSDPTATYTWNDDHEGTATVEVFDGAESATDTASVTVNNVAPSMLSIEAPVDPVQIGTPVDVTGHFSDPGDDSHTATINWGDDTETPGDVENGEVAGSNIYESPGVYVITITVTDDDEGSGSMEYRYVVVFDTAGGFVIGAGWFESPAGAYLRDPTAAGKANFGFVARYNKGSTAPTGNCEFRLKAGDLDFKSDYIQWLVIAGYKAQFKGTGTINGEGNYGFLIVAIDGDLKQNPDVDRIRIKIWDIDNNDEIVYDSQLGGDENEDPITPLGGGQIAIHKK